MASIIVVEDDTEQLEELIFFLNRAGHQAAGAVSSSSLEELLASVKPDIVLLDYNLPDATGLDIVGRLRLRFGQEIGIVMVTARGQSLDRVECRRAGANDYLVKPVNFAELLAVVSNLLALLKPDQADGQPGWQIYPDELMIVPPGKGGVGITFQETLILMTFAAAPDRLVSRDDLIRALGHQVHAYDERSLEAAISRIRKKLPALPDGRSPVQAVRGVGYKFLQPLAVRNQGGV